MHFHTKLTNHKLQLFESCVSESPQAKTSVCVGFEPPTVCKSFDEQLNCSACLLNTGPQPGSPDHVQTINVGLVILIAQTDYITITFA